MLIYLGIDNVGEIIGAVGPGDDTLKVKDCIKNNVFDGVSIPRNRELIPRLPRSGAGGATWPGMLWIL